jgi:hypothetical protein
VALANRCSDRIAEDYLASVEIRLNDTTPAARVYRGASLSQPGDAKIVREAAEEAPMRVNASGRHCIEDVIGGSLKGTHR